MTTKTTVETSDTTQIQTTLFTHHEFGEIRTVIKDDEIWFVANDVCRYLELSNPRKAIANLDDDEKDVTFCYTLGGKQKVNIISESGLFTLVMRSNKPDAKRFQKWVTKEILPSIRKTGIYAPNHVMSEILTTLKTTVDLLNVVVSDRLAPPISKNQLPYHHVSPDDNRPIPTHDDIAEAINDAKNTFFIKDFATLLRAHDVDMSTGQLYGYLRKNGYIHPNGGPNQNQPTEKSIQNDLIKTRKILRKDGTVEITRYPVITQNGKHYFLSIFTGVTP